MACLKAPSKASCDFALSLLSPLIKVRLYGARGQSILGKYLAYHQESVAHPQYQQKYRQFFGFKEVVLCAAYSDSVKLVESAPEVKQVQAQGSSR